MKKSFHLFLPGLLLVSGLSFGQTITPVAFDLAAPIDVNLDAEGNPWVTQSGAGMNDGLVQKIHPDGMKETVIEGLPSFFNVMTNELQGPLSTQVMADGRIFVCQGGGPDSLSGSIMEFHLDDYVAKGAPLVPADRQSIIRCGEWALANGFAETNPYSFVLNSEGDFIISDAAANALIQYEVATESFSVLATFPNFMNPTPVGPPFVNVVPTRILAHPEGGYLVSSLTGFPFLDGAAKIYRVMDDGSTSVYAEGLTLLTDMDFDPNDGQLIALQFAAFGPVDTTFGFIFNSAQLIKVGSGGALDTLAAGFGPSPGLAIAEDGSAYLTHLFLGQLLKTEALSSHATDKKIPLARPLGIFPNPGDGQIAVELALERSKNVDYRLTDLWGRVVVTGSLGRLPAGASQAVIDFSHNGLESGTYLLHLLAEEEIYFGKIVIR